MTQNTVFHWLKNNFLLSHQKLVFFTRFNLDMHLRGGHDAEDGEQDHGEQRGGGDGEELAQPVARHQQQHVQTPGL